MGFRDEQPRECSRLPSGREAARESPEWVWPSSIQDCTSEVFTSVSS